MTDFALARSKMIESQVRPNGITDARIIDAMADVPREVFVPEERRALAYVDDDIEIAPGRYLIEPMALAKLIQLADIEPRDHVLHVGCGTGYATAILSRLCNSVVAIDEDPALAERAATALAPLAAGNAKVVQARHVEGWPADGPYDAILIDGRVPVVPPVLLDQLKDGGRLVAVVGEHAVATAMRFSRAGTATSSMPAFEASVARLPGISLKKQAFVF